MAYREPANIIARRRQEETLSRNAAIVAEQRHLGERIAFETRTGAAYERAQRRAAALKENERLRTMVNERRQQLRSLLEAERQQFEAEVEASFETPEQVRARMFAHARELRDAREARRQETVQQLLARKAVADNDELRTIASKALAERVGLQQAEQLRQRADRLRIEERTSLQPHVTSLILSDADLEPAALAGSGGSSENNNSNSSPSGSSSSSSTSSSSAAAAAAKLDREKIAAEARRRLAAELRGALDLQVATRGAVTSAEQAAAQAEAQAELAGIRAQLTSEAQAELRRKAVARDEGVRVQRANLEAERQARTAHKAAAQAAEAADLAAALAQVQAEEAAAKLAADVRKAEINTYRSTLASQAAATADGAAALAVRIAEEEAEERRQAALEWGNRQAQWDEAAAARVALAHTTAGVQRQQIASKASSSAAAREATLREVPGWPWRDVQQPTAGDRRAAMARAMGEAQHELAGRQAAKAEAAKRTTPDYPTDPSLSNIVSDVLTSRGGVLAVLGPGGSVRPAGIAAAVAERERPKLNSRERDIRSNVLLG